MEAQNRPGQGALQPLQAIAHYRGEFKEKFGIPRQSGLVEGLRGRVVFCPAYRSPQAVRGLQGFSHLWLLWQFSAAAGRGWSPTVRPPRLGGNKRVGVFATRSPFRPNPVGLSCVKLVELQLDPGPGRGPELVVAGADLMDGTPIFDIKPYLPYADCHPEAVGGFAGQADRPPLQVAFAPGQLEKVPPCRRAALQGVLAQDPRPAYQDDPGRVYGMAFAGLQLHFTVEGTLLTVRQVEEDEGEASQPKDGER